jgi:arginine N-succinyltransferase
MTVVRLARPNDLDALVELARTVDASMTTVPKTRETMAERLAEADRSAAVDRVIDGTESYLFVLQEGDRLVGLSAIYATVGVDRPFYSYKVSSISQASPELGVRVDTRILHLVNDYAGTSVVGTLFLHPDARGGGRGRLLSLARFVFMAAHRERFGDRVMAEMRGLTDASGTSPFWNAVGRRFFQRELSEADLRSGHEFRHISDLFPTYPIYADLLPSEAQAVIGRTHPDAEPAVALLQEQGMRDHHYVDIFDAGLCLHAFIDDLEIVRSTWPFTLASGCPPDVPSGPRWLVADPALESFSVVSTPVSMVGDELRIEPAGLKETGWEPGTNLLATPAKRVRQPPIGVRP